MAKKFILNADDFGMSKALNRAVLEAYEAGILKSASLAANGEAFDEAVDVIIPKCPELGVGIHLNITEGTSLCSDIDTLTDPNMNFKNSFIPLLIKSYNSKDQSFMAQIEREFRRQIEKVLSKTKATHIDSHSHVHAIPKIFEMVCKLANEYEIPEVRTHFEKFYFIPDPVRYINKIYWKNLSKKMILNFLSIINENTLTKYKLKTNDYLIGTSYSACMDSLAISYGLRVLKYDNITVEAFIHPKRYDEGSIDNFFDEYMITKNKKLKDKIIRLGYDITNYVENSDAEKQQ